MKIIADLLMEMNTPISFDNIEKYGISKEDFAKEVVEEPVESKSKVKKCKEELMESLNKYTLETFNRGNVVAYMIFNNAEMEDLIEKYPRTK